jgi:plasmid stabilization system protein ParE
VAFRVVWTREGESNLEEVVEQLSAIDSDAADRLLAGIFETVDLLERFPFIGARYERRGRKTRYPEVQYQRYRIFYRVNEAEETVYVMKVWHSARDEPQLPGTRD